MVDVGPQTASGAKLYMGTTALVAATDSFIEVSEVGTLPEFGREYEVIKWKPISDRAARKFKGGYDDGDVTIMLGKDLTNAGQLALQAAQDSDFDFNFKVVDNDDVPPVATAGASMTAASPGVVTLTAHGFAVNTPVTLVPVGAGVLPTGIVSGTTYYVKTVLTADTFTVSATPGGTVINTTGSPSGTITVTTVPVGSITYFKAKVTAFKTLRGDGTDITKATVALAIKSGSLAETVHIP